MQSKKLIIGETLELSLDDLRPECEQIVDRIGSISETARLLGVSRTAVRDALKDWGPDKPFQYIDLRIRILQVEQDVALADVHLIFEHTNI